jgi:hypothetical protein
MVFSDYYNFMSELIKRLKPRIRQCSSAAGAKGGLYKFRRPKEMLLQKPPS